MANPAQNVLFSSDLWTRALESYGSAAHLTVQLFDAEARPVFGAVHPTPLFQFLQETTGYDPGIFTECARRCLAQTNGRAPVLMSEYFGLATIGTSLVLDGDIVGAAVGGYALVDFSQASEIQHLARRSGVSFDRLWQVVREQKPVPRRRLVLNGELLQVLGDAILAENSRTRRYGAALTRSETELRALTARLFTSQEDERRRLARDLHDDLVQRLAYLQNQVALSRLGGVANPGELDKQLADIEDHLARISEDVRAISHGLHPSILDDLGLEVAARQLVGDFAARTSQPALFKAENVPDTISTPIATAIYRIAQEALANVRKHAPEAHVSFMLSGLANELRLVIKDDGPGFDTKQISQHAGLGLISMQERAHLVGGQVKVTSKPGQGTRIEVRVPWQQGV